MFPISFWWEPLSALMAGRPVFFFFFFFFFFFSAGHILVACSRRGLRLPMFLVLELVVFLRGTGNSFPKEFDD